MKKAMIAALLGATLLTSGAVAAVQNDSQDATQQRMTRDPMTMADANQDGVVTRDETIAAVTARFAKLDANKDGKVTREERHAAREAMGKRMRGPDGQRGPGMKRGSDADGDGVLTRDEATAAVTARFAKLDANKDGKITREERHAAREAMGKRMRGPDGERGPRGHGMKRGADANGDGALTLDEQRAQALKRFDFIDRNGDGKVDQAERSLVRGMMREMGAGGGNGRGHHRGHGPRHGGNMPPAPPANGS